MNNEDIVNLIKKWQNDCNFYPLTCENDSNHRVLEPFIDKGIVKLKCLDCDYVQNYIPDIIKNINK